MFNWIKNLFNKHIMTEILSVNKEFIDFECKKYIKYVQNLFVTDKDMVLPTKEQIKEKISEIDLWDIKFDYDKVFCQQFGFVYLGRLIELLKYSDWCVGFGIKIVPDTDNHFGVLILDKELDLHFISGQSGSDTIVEKKQCMFLIYLF